MRVKADQDTPDFQFSDERIGPEGSCAWSEYEDGPLVFTKENEKGHPAELCHFLVRIYKGVVTVA